VFPLRRRRDPKTLLLSFAGRKRDFRLIAGGKGVKNCQNSGRGGLSGQGGEKVRGKRKAVKGGRGKLLSLEREEEMGNLHT